MSRYDSTLVKIASVTPIAVTYPHGREAMSYFFLRIDTDDGLTGYGEACDSYGCSYAGVLGAVVNDAYAPLLIDEELMAVEPLVERLRLHTRRRLGDQWIAPQARSAVEIALWDLVGKAAGRSVSALMGRVRDRVHVYASWSFLEKAFGSSQYQAGRTAVFVTWDEDDSSMSNQIPAIVVAPSVPAGVAPTTAFNHYSMLRSTEEMLGLSPLLGAAATATSMRSAFNL